MRLLGSALCILAAACSNPTAPGGRASPPPATDAATATTQRFLDRGVPPPEFTDPKRRERLATAFPAIEKLFAEWREKNHVPGLAVGVVIDGDLAWSRGYGVRDVTSNAPVDEATQFRIASMSKSFTAMAILELRDQGKLALDEPAATYVPQLASVAYPTRDSPLVTVRMLLTHSAGFPEDNPSGDRGLAMTDDELDRAVAGGLPFSHAPGTAFEYANLGFELLGRIVTCVSGMRYQDYVRTTILEPLRMDATTYDVKQTSADHVATGYRFDDGTYVVEPSLGDGAGGAMGGLFTTLHDMARYAAFHLAAWPPRDDTESGPLKRSSVREMEQGVRHSGFSVRLLADGRPLRASTSAYAYGLSETEDCNFARMVTHGGGLPGWGSWIALLPEHGVAIVALANLTYSAPAAPAREAFLAMSATGALVTRTVKPAPALLAGRDAANRLLVEWDDARVASFVADNFLLDESADRWKSKLAKLRETHGTCRPDSEVDAENALRGRWKMTCDRGWLSMAVTLAPTNPPRVQKLEIVDGLPPDARLASAAARAAKLTIASDDAALAGWLGPKVELAALRKNVADAAVSRGACTVGKTLEGDGRTKAKLALDCTRAPATLDIALDDASGKVTSLRITGPDYALGKCAQ